MRNIELGVSLYPEQESGEDIKKYLELASKYGVTHVFTSLFSVEGSIEEVKSIFSNLCDQVHASNMKLCADVNSETLEIFGASPHNLKVFSDMGIDEIRMDMSYGDIRDSLLIENEFGINVQFSAFMTELLMDTVRQSHAKERITMCHNFYPQRYTGTSLDKFMSANKVWMEQDVKIAAFISSNNPKAHGPWPVNDGLPTLERHRYQSINYQIRDLTAMGITTVYFGNAFATEDELKEAKETLDMLNAESKGSHQDVEYLMRQILPTLGERRVIIEVDVDDSISQLEREIFLEFNKHCEIGDSNEYMLRSRVTRMLYKGSEIPYRPYNKPTFEPGDVLIVNDNLKHYRCEIQICRNTMENDGQRNYLGHIDAKELSIVESIKPGDYYSFIEKKRY